MSHNCGCSKSSQPRFQRVIETRLAKIVASSHRGPIFQATTTSFPGLVPDLARARKIGSSKFFFAYCDEPIFKNVIGFSTIKISETDNHICDLNWNFLPPCFYGFNSINIYEKQPRCTFCGTSFGGQRVLCWLCERIES